MKKKDQENRRKMTPNKGKVDIRIFKRTNINQYDNDETTSSDTEIEEEKVHEGVTTKRKYKFVQWKAKSKSNTTHMSILDIHDKSVVVDGQVVPGGCILCSERMYLASLGECERHYDTVHKKHSTTVKNYRLLMCKCDDVPSRGTDGRMRNRHFHCPYCFHPSDNLLLLAKHLFTKHGLKPSEISHLKYKPKK